jgi:hypothetical protein
LRATRIPNGFIPLRARMLFAPETNITRLSVHSPATWM